jgi:hypothetical protein
MSPSPSWIKLSCGYEAIGEERMQMEKKSATLEVDMSAVTMKSSSKAKAVLGKGGLRRRKRRIALELWGEAHRGGNLKATFNLGQRQAVTMLHQPQAKHARGAVGGCPGKTSVITTEAV